MEQFIQLLERFKSIKNDDYHGLQITRSLETKLVWSLLCLPRSPRAATNGVTGSTSQEELLQLAEAQKRLDAIEALLLHTTLERNPCSDIPYAEQFQHNKYWEVEFWRLLGHFVAYPDPRTSSPSARPTGANPDETLQSCRSILSMLENRDVLYSVMVCRLVGPRLQDFPDGVDRALNNDDADPRTKVFIAKKFLEDEAGGKGTNQVIQRFCDMAIRSWGTAGK